MVFKKNVFNKTSVKNIICLFVFCFLILQVSVHCTYLFRNTGRDARQNVLGFYNEKPDSLDVVFIGGSNVYRFWDPMNAWNHSGIASYNYSVSGMPTAGTITAIQDIEKTQAPDVIVVDVRRVLSGYGDSEITAGMRNVWDSQDLSLHRMQSIRYYADLNHIPVKEAISAYLDIIQYHNNYEALGDEQHWKWIDNRASENLDTEDFYKGFSISAAHELQKDPSDAIHPIKGKLSEDSRKIILDIIEYCNQKSISLLLCASPYVTNERNQGELNAIEELAREHGCGFVDTNKYYAEMGLDFTEDFYDTEHVNILGAEKYTAFMIHYLKENYDLTDHREDQEYSSWNDLYTQYLPVVEARKEEAIKAARS